MIGSFSPYRNDHYDCWRRIHLSLRIAVTVMFVVGREASEVPVQRQRQRFPRPPNHRSQSNNVCLDRSDSFVSALVSEMGIDGDDWMGCSDPRIEAACGRVGDDDDDAMGLAAWTHCCQTCATSPSVCVDLPPSFLQSLAESSGGGRVRGRDRVGMDGRARMFLKDGCSAPRVANACRRDDRMGRVARTVCCQTCGGNDNDNEDLIESVLPTEATTERPVRLFLQSGQSECVGQASSSLLLRKDAESYPDLVGTQPDVWFAGYPHKNDAPDRFFVRPMALVDSEVPNAKGMFGPEISLGRRLADAVAAASNETLMSPVVVMKYCWGGSNVQSQWNPDSRANYWDRATDDGTAAWLLENGVANLRDKSSLYANLIYTIRRTVESFQMASPPVPFTFEGFFWIQGQADQRRTWYEYGTDLVRLFSRLREDLGQPTLPVVDTGGMPHHNLQSGKVYASQELGHSVVSAMGLASSNPADDDCIPGASNACPGSTLVQWDVYDHYGYDPATLLPPYDTLLPPDENSTTPRKEFRWYKSFPTNQHGEYDKVILTGRMLANAFLRHFPANKTDTDPWAILTPPMEADDPAVLFPWEPCPDGEGPTANRICWMDQRADGNISQPHVVATRTTTLIDTNTRREPTRWSGLEGKRRRFRDRDTPCNYSNNRMGHRPPSSSESL